MAPRSSAPPRGRSSIGPEDSANSAPARWTQRERLIEAIIALSSREGYPNVSVAQISATAGVSSATFYEQFDGKEGCLLAAYRETTERMLGQMEPVDPQAVRSDADWAEAAQAALSRFLSAVESDPGGTSLMLIESLAAGPELQKERKAVIEIFEGRARDLLDSASASHGVLDLPPVALLGALRSIIARQLRSHAEDQLPLLADDLVAWLESYSAAAGRPRWSTGPEALLPAARTRRAQGSRGVQTRARTRLPRGRHGLPASVVARSQRTRIIHATAEMTMAKGYAQTTVTDIVAAAGVARDVFYEHYRDKQHAFLEAQQYPTQHILDTCAAAYFAANDWPQRVWDCLRTLIDLIAENPAISHLRLVECYAAGPEAIRRAEDITRAFTIFLEEGYRYRPEASELPRLCSEAIAGAIFELIQRHIAHADNAGLARRLPQLTYIAIAPFTGAEEAIRTIEQLAARPPRSPQIDTEKRQLTGAARASPNSPHSAIRRRSTR